MKKHKIIKAVCFCALVILFMVTAQLLAGSSGPSRGGLFGDQKFESTFEGKIQDSKLIGELTSSRGARKVTGTKVVRTSRRQSST